MPFTKNPQWKQRTPRDQLVQLLSGAEGDCSNIVDDTTLNPQRAASRAAEWIQGCQYILRNCPDLEKWPE